MIHDRLKLLGIAGAGLLIVVGIVSSRAASDAVDNGVDGTPTGEVTPRESEASYSYDAPVSGECRRSPTGPKLQRGAANYCPRTTIATTTPVIR